MIDSLRKRMIWICCSSVIGVFLIIFLLINALGARLLNANMDLMTDRIAQGNGVLHPFDKNEPLPPGLDRAHGFFTEESLVSTRFFTVWASVDGQVIEANLESVSSVTREEAYEYAREVLAQNAERGWRGNFRFKVFSTPRGKGIVFVDGSTVRYMKSTLFLISGMVLIVSMVIILLLIVVLSKRAVRPIAQSYEKQKQFVTDANHELKTPLTLILTNLDIVEQELGHSEWLDDIRAEGQRMSSLVGQLTALSRLDEDSGPGLETEFSFSDVCSDTVSEFLPLIDSRGLRMTASVQPELFLRGEEGAIRQLLAILMDNAVKYCDPSGEISFTAAARWQTELRVENSCAGVADMELDRLFDRFYRADKARTAGTSFGIGLSLAKSIAEKHRGEIRAYQAGPGRIGFRVVFKS